MPLFSVIIPVYNAKQYLARSIESVINQTFDDYEIILVDDGSNDGSASICDRYSDEHNNISAIHKKNEGSVLARKTGMQRSRGRFVLNVDSDDYLETNLLKNMQEIIEKFNPDVISYGHIVVDEENNITDKRHDQIPAGFYKGNKLNIIRKEMLFNCEDKHFNGGNITYALWSKVIKREFIKDDILDIPSNIRMGEDVAVSIPLICSVKSLYISDFYGYYYVQRAGSIVHSFNVNEIDNISALAKHLYKNTPGLPKNNIDGYYFFMILQQLEAAAHASQSYRNFITYIERNLRDMRVKEAIDKFDAHKMGTKAKFLTRIVKLNRWKIFWIINKTALK